MFPNWLYVRSVVLLLLQQQESTGATGCRG
jgi:hypothetical protein